MALHDDADLYVCMMLQIVCRMLHGVAWCCMLLHAAACCCKLLHVCSPGLHVVVAAFVCMMLHVVACVCMFLHGVV